MLNIEFKSQSNIFELLQGSEEYNLFWNKEKTNIVRVIEKISGLKFKTQEIKAVIYEGISKSQPLMLRASYSLDVKKATLIHELCHILLTDNKIKFEFGDVHDMLYLILFDIWNNLYGKDFAKKMAQIESDRNQRYKKSWDKVFLLNKTGRGVEFLRIKKCCEK